MITIQRATSILGLLSLTLTLAGTADAQRAKNKKKDKQATSDLGKRVQLHLERGIEFYAERQFELAIIEFRAGFALDPRPDFLFALAQAERLSGDCSTAVVYYRRFLQTKPDINQSEAASVNMKRCVRALESGPGGKRLARPSDALSEAERTSAAPPPLTPLANSRPTIGRQNDVPTKPWYRDVIGTSLLVSGVVGLGVGVGFFVASNSDENDALGANDQVVYERSIDSARSKRNVSIATASIGSALLVGAMIRYLTRDSREKRTRLTATPHRDGGSIAVFGRF